MSGSLHRIFDICGHLRSGVWGLGTMVEGKRSRKFTRKCIMADLPACLSWLCASSCIHIIWVAYGDFLFIIFSNIHLWTQEHSPWSTQKCECLDHSAMWSMRHDCDIINELIVLIYQYRLKVEIFRLVEKRSGHFNSSSKRDETLLALQFKFKT